ncbi:MAG: hypothetical protein ACK5GN_14070 [Pseudomonadota bacterium]|jgi:hypothetical protein
MRGVTRDRRASEKTVAFDIRVEPANQARAIKIMEVVSASLTARAFQVKAGSDENTIAERDGILVPYHVEELYKQITKTETYGTTSPRTHTHIVGRKPTGRLALMLDDCAGQFRRSFKDGKRQRVEKVIEEFADTVELVVAFRREQQEESVRWQRERQHNRARTELEEARVKALKSQLELIATARNLREYLTHLSAYPDSEVKSTWVTWVSGYLESVEASIGIPDISSQGNSVGSLD